VANTFAELRWWHFLMRFVERRFGMKSKQAPRLPRASQFGGWRG
jgi:hypothetical protein